MFTGYLKQLLASFNLPKYKVYTKEQQEYFNKYGTNKDFRELNVIPTIKMKNNNQILERLQIVASTVSDFAKYINFVILDILV